MKNMAGKSWLGNVARRLILDVMPKATMAEPRQIDRSALSFEEPIEPTQPIGVFNPSASPLVVVTHDLRSGASYGVLSAK